MLRHKLVVVEVRIGHVHAIDLLHLSGTQGFVLVQAPNALEQALASQHFVKASDAPAKTVGRVKERRIAIGDLSTETQQIWGHLRKAATLQ